MAHNKTSSSKQNASPFLCCGRCGRCGRHCHHGGCGHFCYGFANALLSLIHFLSVEIGKILNFNQIKERFFDGRRDGGTEGQTD